MYGVPYQEWNKMSEEQKRSAQSVWEEHQGKLKNESEENRRKLEAVERQRQKDTEAFNMALRWVGGGVLVVVVIGIAISKINKRTDAKKAAQRPRGSSDGCDRSKQQ